MSSHTPGPWRFEQISRSMLADGKGNKFYVLQDSDGQEVIADWLKEADARLIAAAPDLLEALRKAEAALSDIGDAEREPGDDVAWLERRAAEALPIVRAAIKKAEGGE